MIAAALVILAAQSGTGAVESSKDPYWLSLQREANPEVNQNEQSFDDFMESLDRQPKRTVLNNAAACAAPITNGTMVDGGFPLGDHLSKLRVRNGTDSYAFVKIIDAGRGLIGTMFLAKGGEGTISDIPHGSYEIKFAFGGRLLADCQTLKEPEQTSAFDGPVQFQATKTVTETETGTLTRWSASNITVTLYPVAHGNAETHAISLTAFNAD